jgi:hypothetical protein
MGQTLLPALSEVEGLSGGAKLRSEVGTQPRGNHSKKSANEGLLFAIEPLP